MQFSFQMLGLHILFPGTHLICIPADRIDLSVMYDKPIRMCAFPAWVGIGTESGMHQRDRRFIILVLKIFKKRTELPHQEHPLISDRPA